MHIMTTNDERLYDKFRPDCIPMKNITWQMIKIDTNMEHLGVKVRNSNWGKCWRMKKKTSVKGVTKPLS